MEIESIADSLKKYKSADDVYNKYPFLRDLTGDQIVTLGLTSVNIGDFDIASACRIIILLEKEKFKQNNEPPKE